MKMLLPVDGSEASDRAVERAIKVIQRIKETADLHLFNVQAPISAGIGAHLGRDTLDKVYQEEAAKQLRSAMAKLDAAGIKYVRHVGIGDPAETISEYAGSQGCDLIMMGTRGMGAVSNLVLGSVATKVIHLSTVPILLLK